MSTGEPQVVLHSSWRGIAGGLGGSGAVALLGILTFSVGRGGWGAVVLTVGGLLLLSVMLFDFPVSTVLDADGVLRRAPLRHHRIVWDRIHALARTRPGLLQTMRWRSGGLASGGLVAVVGRRRYLLVDQPESRSEYEELEQLLGHLGLDTPGLPAPAPEATPPTWLYRRRRTVGAGGGHVDQRRQR